MFGEKWCDEKFAHQIEGNDDAGESGDEEPLIRTEWHGAKNATADVSEGDLNEEDECEHEDEAHIGGDVIEEEKFGRANVECVDDVDEDEEGEEGREENIVRR